MNRWDSAELEKFKRFWKLHQELTKGYEKPIALTNGCFDMFHKGHLFLFDSIKWMDDVYLVAAIDSDEMVKKNKGDSRPIISEGERRDIVGGLTIASAHIMNDGLSLIDIIEVIKPDYYYKGDDYNLDTLNPIEKLALYKANPNVIIKFIPRLGDYSTTNIINKS